MASVCSVEVYPYEGPPVLLDAKFILSVRTTKNLRSPAGAGQFIIELRPSGNSSDPLWRSIITPGSFTVIGMRRNGRARITMMGVVSSLTEEEDWSSAQTVQKSLIIEGVDFSFYFTTMNYYTLGAYAMTAGAVAGDQIIGSPVAFEVQIDQGSQSFTPDQLARLYYDKVMFGKTGLLSEVFVPYQNNSRLTVGSFMGSLFEKYPSVEIPTAVNYAATEGSWLAKFTAMLPFPFYEFYVDTVIANQYTLNDASSQPISMVSLPDAPAAFPATIGRVNPLPFVSVTAAQLQGASTLGAMDMTKWNALTSFSPDESFISSAVSYSTDEVRNFYTINPTSLADLVTGPGSATGAANFLFATISAYDAASVKRYGYRPETVATDWFYDPSGNTNNNANFNAAETIAVLLSRLFSYYEPTSFMLRAEVTLPLRPDITMGSKFQYAPFNDGTLWDFYIEGVSHVWSFPGASAFTKLTLTRGLPHAVYADPTQAGILTALHLGNAQRVGGQYKVGLPSGTGPGLQTFGASTQTKNFFAAITQGFASP